MEVSILLKLFFPPLLESFEISENIKIAMYLLSVVVFLSYLQWMQV